MSGFLRFIGIVNAAVWFGSGIFFSLVVLPGVFSPDAHKLFGVPADSRFYDLYPGGVALVLFGRFFVLQYFCGVVALLHLFAEKLYLGRAFPRLGTTIVVCALGLSLIGGAWVQPKLIKFRETKYSTKASADEIEQASHSFGVWHGLSQAANLFVLAGLLVHLMRVSRPEEPGRYGTLFPKFRG